MVPDPDPIFLGHSLSSLHKGLSTMNRVLTFRHGTSLILEGFDERLFINRSVSLYDSAQINTGINSNIFTDEVGER